jgi:hypothetical protein
MQKSKRYRSIPEQLNQNEKEKQAQREIDERVNQTLEHLSKVGKKHFQETNEISHKNLINPVEKEDQIKYQTFENLQTADNLQLSDVSD